MAAPGKTIDPDVRPVSDAGRAFLLVEPLGRGGNASAWLALATEGDLQGLPFALKFFLHDDPGRREAFRREIAYLKTQSHPAILSIYDSGTLRNGTPFYVSRYMATTLGQVMAAESAPTLDRLLFASQLCSALAFLADPAHPILHRDLKAANVFVNGRTCLLGDFGMMHRFGAGGLDPAMPQEARTPEMKRFLNGGPEPDVRSDVFSLGVVLYRLFTGEPALAQSEKATGPVRRAETFSVGGRYATPLDDVLERMLADDPARRPTAEGLLNVFTGLVADEARRRRGFRH